MQGPVAVLAQAGADDGLGGWWVGVAIGVAVVVVVALVIITLIVLARRITRQTALAVAALDDAAQNTGPLWEVERTNRTAHAILEGAVRAREALEEVR